MRRFSILTFAVVLLALQFASADTLQLVNVGPGSAGGPNASNGVYVYPYYFSINGSLALTPLICDSYDNEVALGESWNVTVTPLNSFAGMMTPTAASGLSKQQAYEEAAFLLSLLQGDLSPADAAGVNFAIWNLFATDVPSTAYSNTGAAAWRTIADSAIQTLPSSFYNNFLVYTPIAGTQPNGYGLPQEYIGYVPPAVPEPASLSLLVGGGFGLLGVLRRKKSL